MAGCRVHEARTGVVGHVVAVEQRHVEIIALAAQRVGAGDARQSSELTSNPLVLDAWPWRMTLLPALSAKISFSPGFGPVVVLGCGHFIQAVADAVGIADGAVAGHGPRSRGPDDDKSPPSGHLAPQQPETSPRSCPTGSRDTRLRPRPVRSLDHRPHHRLGAAIELARHGELHQLFSDAGFGIEAHGQVGIVPVADDARDA
jgi:hypothetical protein